MLFDLRQGVGRLIRSQRDKGFIAILDSRVHYAIYGKSVLRTIGLHPYTDLERVCKGIATRHARQSTD
jgi:Rad3-related DNA helicase